jgi:hypothetical protein
LRIAELPQASWKGKRGMIALIQQPGSKLPWTQVFNTCENEIPVMTNPLGKHWNQPTGYVAEMDDTHIMLTKAQFDLLSNIKQLSIRLLQRQVLEREGGYMVATRYHQHVDPAKIA